MLTMRPIEGCNEFNSKRLLVRIQPQGVSAPVIVAGRGVTASRVGPGQLRVTVTDGGLGRLVGFDAAIRGAASSYLNLQGGAFNSANRTFDIFVVADGNLQFTKGAADGAAATTTAETVIGATPTGIPVAAMFAFTPAAALTANDTNFADLLVQKRTAGGAAVTICDFQTKITGGTGNWTQWQPVNVATTVAAAAGDALTFSITKTGTGVVVPAGVLTCFALQDMAAATDNEISVELVFASDVEA